MTSTCIVAIVEKVSYEVSHDLHSVVTAIRMLLEYLKNLQDIRICYAYLLQPRIPVITYVNFVILFSKCLWVD
jgi:hypothetical protein